jgi:hypothetical protein
MPPARQLPTEEQPGFVDIEGFYPQLRIPAIVTADSGRS